MRHFAYLFPLICSPFLTAATIKVPQDYPHLQRAINAAAPGDTIQLAAGTYKGSVIVTKSLSIQGSGPQQTQLLPSDFDGNVLSFSYAPDNANFSLENLSLVADENFYDGGTLLSINGSQPAQLKDLSLDFGDHYGSVSISESQLHLENVSAVANNELVFGLHGLKEGSKIKGLTCTRKAPGTEYSRAPLYITENSKLVLENIQINASNNLYLATVSGSLTHANFQDASIPASKIKYENGARPDGPNAESIRKHEEMLAEYGNQMFFGGGAEGPGQAPEFLAEQEPARRELARALNAQFTAGADIETAQKVLSDYIKALVDSIEYGPVDYTADAAIAAELRYFESIHGAEATATFLQTLPAHPEIESYTHTRRYYVSRVSDATRTLYDRSVQNKSIAEAKELIKSTVAEWPTEHKTPVTAQGFGTMLVQLSEQIHALPLEADRESAMAEINTVAQSAIKQRLQQVENPRMLWELKEGARRSALPFYPFEDLEAFLYSEAGEALRDIDFAESFDRIAAIQVEPISGDLLVVTLSRDLWRLRLDGETLEADKIDEGVHDIRVDQALATIAVDKLRKVGNWYQPRHVVDTSLSDVYPKESIQLTLESNTRDHNIYSATFSPSGTYLSLGKSVYDTLSGEAPFTDEVFQISASNASGYAPNTRGAICQDDLVVTRNVIRSERIGDSNSFTRIPTLATQDIETGDIIWEEAQTGETAAYPLYYDDDNRLQVLRTKPLRLEQRDYSTGEILKTQTFEKNLPAPTDPVLFSASGRLALYPLYGDTAILDLERGQLLGRFASPAKVLSWTELPSGNAIAVADDRAGLRIIDKESGSTIAQLFLDFADNRWLAIDELGNYAVSDSLKSKIQNFAADTEIATGRIAPKTADGSVIARVFEGVRAEAAVHPPAIGQVELPKVTIKLADGTRGLVVEDDIVEMNTEQSSISLLVSASGVNLDQMQLRLYHNGKLLGSGTRGLIVEDDEPENSPTYRERTFKIPLLPGENRFRALAATSDGIESLPSELHLTSSNPAESNGGIRLFTLIVGVDEYTNPKYNLNYAVADAEALAAKIYAKNKDVFTSVENRMLLNQDATRKQILNAFSEIGAQMSARDAFVFYYAGHGVIDSDGDGTFYLAPANITQLYGNSSGLRIEGISAAELRQLSANLAAQKQLFLLDACQSGEALVTIAQRGAAEEQAIAQLARSTGTHWLTASGSEQFATEFDDLGHGAFTYALLQALDGKADTGNGVVTVNELKAYLESAVPELTAEHRGSAQYPSSFGTGQDFPISIF
ncbi:MAG: hypothetical protein CML13_13320 [Puniceicoccaceae bacterium]|nr:hypothetical protein [Puniceicoccaceae bacterium]|tara:strand:+ start:2805 stop:6650 length:3846 start_codon:yes stop_codon:yes gene_type:complete